ncbi:ABC transporter ATP-binding protein [Ornithinimicrobium sufpigmenti]|uniref:ABC transporter ATP-binding protein n=1 Tax=Ornithinimicrobium sufpigmenti TaxID=2508882 RepID=UPI00103649CE|nr:MULTISPECIES: ABC transporter ATP-binding protein [unclassified Ornithinimicrobium]
MTSTENRAPAVAVEQVRKRYRSTQAVDGISMTVAPGETVGILGANGAGKTTLVEMIAGLRTPDSGSIEVLGLHPTRDRARLRQVLGVQLQSAYLHHALTARELVELYRSFYPHPRGTEETLDLVELGRHRDTQFEKLSGGQQQRLSVALALVGRPRMVILDELTTGMDPRARRRMWRAIEALQTDGVTILMVSHAMDEVERLCDRVLLLQDGQVLAQGTPAEVIAQAQAASLEDAFVALTGTTIEDLQMEEL